MLLAVASSVCVVCPTVTWQFLSKQPSDRARYFGTAKKELLSGHLRVGSDAADCTAHALFVCSSTRTRGDAVLCRVTLHTCFCRVCSVQSGAECGQTARLLEHAVPQVEVVVAVVVVVVVVVEHAVLVVLVNRSSVG